MFNRVFAAFGWLLAPVSVLLFVGVLMVSTSCYPAQAQLPPKSAMRDGYYPAEQRYFYDMSVVQTLGNHSYIPLNKDGKPAVHVDSILSVLDAFEKAHPELEVTGWNIEKRQSAYGTSAYLYGLWVDHRPKAQK